MQKCSHHCYDKEGQILYINRDWQYQQDTRGYQTNLGTVKIPVFYKKNICYLSYHICVSGVSKGLDSSVNCIVGKRLSTTHGIVDSRVQTVV